MSRELSPPLPDLLYALAEEGVEDETGDPAGPAWAALLRDGAEIRRLILEELEADEAAAPEGIDPDDWAALRSAYAVIVIRDNRRNRVIARALADDSEFASEWEAVRAELRASPPAVEASDTGETTEGPSSGPLPPRDPE